MDEEKPFSYAYLIGGLLCGAVLGTVCTLILNVALFFVLGSIKLYFLAPLVNAVALILLGHFVLKESKDKGFSRGILISLGLVLVVSTTCGIAILR